jgi:hypothetical protein
MHLHHELQRALAETKTDRTTPPLETHAAHAPHREYAPAVTRRIPPLPWRRPETRPRAGTATPR